MGEEASSGINGFIKKLRGLKPPHAPSDERITQEDESASIASEAATLFSHQEAQAPERTYTAGSESVFDLTKENPGTVIRVRYIDHHVHYPTPEAQSEPPPEPPSEYGWYVTGANIGNKPTLYTLIPMGLSKSIQSFALDTSWQDSLRKIPFGTSAYGAKLPTHDYDVIKQSPQATSWPIKYTGKIVHGADVAPEYYEVLELDVMKSGKAVKESVGRRPLASPKLTLARESIRIK